MFAAGVFLRVIITAGVSFVLTIILSSLAPAASYEGFNLTELTKKRRGLCQHAAARGRQRWDGGGRTYVNTECSRAVFPGTCRGYDDGVEDAYFRYYEDISGASASMGWTAQTATAG